MPTLFRPLRRLIIKSFDEENVRIMAAVKKYAEAHPTASQAHSSRAKSRPALC
jgi:hypothetical protein